MNLRKEQENMRNGMLEQTLPTRGIIAGQRKKEAFALRAKGLTYSDIARSLGVSRQRVQQLVRPPEPLYSLILRRAKNKCEECSLPLSRGSGHIHHISGLDFDFNNEANLLYLCPSCHMKAHKPRKVEK